MKQVKWFDVNQKTPKEGQQVTVIIDSTTDNNNGAYQCTYEKGLFMNYLSSDYYRNGNNLLIGSFRIKQMVNNVIAWCDSNELFNSFDDLCDIVEKKRNSNNKNQNENT